MLCMLSFRPEVTPCSWWVVKIQSSGTSVLFSSVESSDCFRKMLKFKALKTSVCLRKMWKFEALKFLFEKDVKIQSSGTWVIFSCAESSVLERWEKMFQKDVKIQSSETSFLIFLKQLWNFPELWIFSFSSELRIFTSFSNKQKFSEL